MSYLRFRPFGGFGAASGRQPLAPSSTVVTAPTAAVTPSPVGAGSLALVPSHGHRVHKDVVPSDESLGLTPRTNKGN